MTAAARRCAQLTGLAKIRDRWLALGKPLGPPAVGARCFTVVFCLGGAVFLLK